MATPAGGTNWAWAVPAVISIFGGKSAYDSADKQREYAKRELEIAQFNAKLEERELRETVRRQQRQDERLRGGALARIAASGAKLTGTTEIVMEDLVEEQERQVAWMQEAGASQIRLRLESARTMYDAAKANIETQKRAAIYDTVFSLFGYADKAGLMTENPFTGNTMVKSSYGSYRGSYGGGR